MLILGGRAASWRWGAGSLQEIDHPPLLAPVTKRAATVRATDRIAARLHPHLPPRDKALLARFTGPSDNGAAQRGR